MIALKVFCAFLALFALYSGSDASPLEPRVEYKRQPIRSLNAASAVSIYTF